MRGIEMRVYQRYQVGRSANRMVTHPKQTSSSKWEILFHVPFSVLLK